MCCEGLGAKMRLNTDPGRENLAQAVPDMDTLIVS